MNTARNKTADTEPVVPADRATLYVEAASLLPAATDPETVMRVAEWLRSGATILDPSRVTDAARAMARLDTGYHGANRDYDSLLPHEQAEYEGRAAQVVTASLDAR